MKKFLMVFALFFIATGCSNKLKEKIGIATAGPNEYKVQKNRSLEIPPHYDLPEPSASSADSMQEEKIPSKELSK